MSLDLPPTEPRLSPPRITTRSALNLLLLLIAAVFLVLHALHLNADFPNNSPWMDWAKYTDEGWYGDAAIRHFQRGHWYLPGDFNPAVALPVWPLLESAVFYFTGVSLAAARALAVAIFALSLLTSYFLVRRYANHSSSAPSLAPAIGVLLLAVSPFCYSFSRLAILEPLLILLALLALLTASHIQPPEQGSRISLNFLIPLVLLGILITLMVLTKTTAIFLIPSIAWLLWARVGYRLRPFLRTAVLPATIAIAFWLTYYLAFVRPHFLDDYRYLFSANAYTGITLANAVSVLSATVSDAVWMGHLLCLLILLTTLLVVLNPRIARRNPLIIALLLWASGYAAFLAYHNNLQPRYYLVLAVPLTLLVPIVFESILQAPSYPARPGHSSSHLHNRPIAATGIVLALVITATLDARQTLRYVRAPEYTYANAAAQIQQIIAADRRKDPAHNPLLLSISGSDISLMTGLPSICDDFGTMQLQTRIATYNPGWFVTWNHVEDDKMDALAPVYHLQRIAEFPEMDDPERNLLILYRLDPATPSTPPPATPRRPIPRLLQTSLGQQPSVTQLQH